MHHHALAVAVIHLLDFGVIFDILHHLIVIIGMGGFVFGEDAVSYTHLDVYKRQLFPIGKNVLREELQDTLRYAHENGMEIENHTLEHKRHFQMDDATFERQIYLQCLCVDKVLGVDYQEHFVRPFGGDGRDDQRLHPYAKQIGMVGLAHWNVSGSGTGLQKLIAGLAPGNIYLFHTTDKEMCIRDSPRPR